jgi:hypothetical protein
MPKRKTHEDISRLLLGKSFSEVSIALDWPAKFMGCHHRKVFHTVHEGCIVGYLLTGDAKGAAAGALHVITDIVDSGVKKEIKNLTKNRGDGKWQKKRKPKK